MINVPELIDLSNDSYAGFFSHSIKIRGLLEYVYADLWEYAGLSMGHIYLSHSHPIAIYACPIPWDVSHGIPIGMTFPWTSLRIRVYR